MSKSLNFVICGTSLNLQNHLKTEIAMMIPAGIKITWGNIADKNIDLLLVHEMFFYSSSIQKKLQNTHIHYLRLQPSSDPSTEITHNILTYPITNLQHLYAWLQNTFFDYETRYRLDHYHQVEKQDSNVTTIIHQCLNPLNGYIQLFDKFGFLALVDTKNERIWINQEHPTQAFSNHLNQTYATNQFVQEVIKKWIAQDLRSWLWNKTYQYSEFNLPKINKNQCFKLNIWPKFENTSERQKLVKLASCFHQGAEIKTVATAIHTSDEHTIKFVAICELIQLGKYIENTAIKFTALPSGLKTNKSVKIINFFNKLRQKLGL